MSGSLVIKNRQRAFRVNARVLRAMTKSLLKELLEIETFDLGIHIVRAPEMARLNETFLHHKGSTDVITFDYADGLRRASGGSQKPDGPLEFPKRIYGEVFICIDDAMKQAREFRTSWQSEIARYVIHGVLHLLGFDDIRAVDRRAMKREENRLLKKVGRLFPLRKLGGVSRLPP